MNSPENVNTRILIVDDEPAIRNLIYSILSDDYDCVTAESAELALTFLERENFDLVISDINMSGMSGIELVPRVAALSPDTVVVVISGNPLIDAPIEAIRSGAFDYIRKPFDIDQVEMAVKRAVTHGALLVSKRKHENHLEQLVAERTEKLKYLAYYDTLTGLPNRTFYEENLTQTLASAGSVAVFVVSLDRFKGIRDTLGHSMEGRLLKDVAKRIAELTKNGVTAARFEGDEFALSFVNQNPEDLTAFTDDIFEVFRAPFIAGEYEIFLSVSIGVGQSPDDGADAQTLLRNAGAALSIARKQGGNNLQFYTSDLHEKAVLRLTLENDLRRALERNEFELYYQPKINLKTKQVVGMEALVRWNHPELGLVAPLDFIPVAEETGLIVPMGEWILRNACEQSKSWHDKGYRLHIAVNLSTCQFQQRDLAERIAAIVRETGLDPAFLNLEVTESSIMNSTDVAFKILGDLRSTGIRISIDDFGTGHSSLGYLKHLPIDVLKIDKSFVDDVTTSSDDAALVTAVITLAHNLRLKVVAEGVETEAQLDFLTDLKCDQWQGYLFSKPVQAAAFEQMLQTCPEFQP